MADFSLWDSFPFTSSSPEFIEEMIFRGAEFGIGAEITQTQTKIELRQRGFSFGNERFSALWNGIRDEEQGFKHFATINQDALAFDSVLPQRDYFNTRYRYVGQFQSIDRFGTIGSANTLAIDSDIRLTPAQALPLLADLALTRYGASMRELDSIEIIGAILNPNIS